MQCILDLKNAGQTFARTETLASVRPQTHGSGNHQPRPYLLILTTFAIKFVSV